MIKTLVTGFSPFDGRSVNASWIAARSLAGETHLQAMEIPVAWGEPAKLLAPLCHRDCPEIIISMGEGREGWFDIETAARNARNERPDNEGTLPNGRPIVPDGPARLAASVDASGLHRKLLAQRLPVRVSRDAGAFLCEEMLYTLEILRARHARLCTVVFVHLPPYGTPVNLGREETPCTEPLLARFARSLLEAVTELHRQTVERAAEDCA